MMKKNQLLAALAVGLLAGPMVALAQYDYQTIDYPGAPDTQIFGINDRGHVVGNGFSDTDTFPFVYDSKKGTFTDVTPAAGFASTTVLGINDAGVLVGSVNSLDETTRSGFIRDKKGNFTVFDHPDAVSETRPRAVNNKGLVTGYRDSPDDQLAAENGFIYDSKTGTFTDIVQSVFTIAQGINSQGDVVGHAIFHDAFGFPDPCGTSGSFVRRGWLRTADGTVTYFDVNGDGTSARAIADSGTIAGFVFDSVTGSTKGFVTELDGWQCQSITIAGADLLEFPGAVATFVGGIKNSGAVVSSYDDPTNTHGYIAFPQ